MRHNELKTSLRLPSFTFTPPSYQPPCDNPHQLTLLSPKTREYKETLIGQLALSTDASSSHFPTDSRPGPLGYFIPTIYSAPTTVSIYRQSDSGGVLPQKRARGSKVNGIFKTVRSATTHHGSVTRIPKPTEITNGRCAERKGSRPQIRRITIDPCRGRVSSRGGRKKPRADSWCG